jgi:hypothetical protein
MRINGLGVVAVVGMSFAWGCAEEAPSTSDAPGAAATASPTPGAIIIDHRCTDLGRVPTDRIAQARTQFRIAYGHTSHGSQVVTGIQAIRGAEGSNYYYTSASGFRAGVFLNDAHPSGDLGSSGDLGWRDRTRDLLNRSDNDRNVVLWSWCGGVSSSTEAQINAYLNAMDQLEQQYPQVKFIYMTGHLDGTGMSGTLNQRNEQIRSFCRERRKVLFDFADIESFDPDGALDYRERLANDNCDYDSNADNRHDRNWATDWHSAHPGTTLAQHASACGSCAHSQKLNCSLKGRAFWWMMARLAGWNGA